MPTSKKTIFARTAFCLAVAASWGLSPSANSAQSPGAAQSADTTWFKGNLHTHTINSDGDSSPDAVARWYKEHRYNFLVLSDHNFLTETAGLNGVFAAKDKFLLIPGEEVTSRHEDKPIHVNAFEIRSTLEPAFGDSVVDTIQKNVDAIRGAGGMPSLNHPNFVWAITPDELKQVRDLKLFEVYNGHYSVNNIGGGGRPGLEEMWDIVLTAGREVYGIAVDDAHSFKTIGPEYANPGRGWVMVKARDLSTRAVLDALEAGEFYASTGVELAEMSRSGKTLSIRVEPKGNTKYTIDFVGREGKLLKRSVETAAAYTLAAGDGYVRAVVRSSNGQSAWAQPVFER